MSMLVRGRPPSEGVGPSISIGRLRTIVSTPVIFTSYSANCAARQRSAAPSPSFSLISSNFVPTSVRAA